MLYKTYTTMKKITILCGLIFGSLMVFGQNNSNIPFVQAKRYFVKNTYKDGALKNPKIATQKQFDKLFGMATVMGENSTVIDFSKQYVVAVIEKETFKTTTLIAKYLSKNPLGEIEFEFQLSEGEEQSSSTVPCLLIIVDKKYKGKVVLKKQ